LSPTPAEKDLALVVVRAGARLERTAGERRDERFTLDG
jgi:hypothetical protein